MTRRIVLLVTSPRMPAGLLTAAAWDLVRAHPVLTGADGDQITALRAAGATVTVVPEATAATLLDAAQPVVVWLAGPGGDEFLARELGLKLAREPGLAELELLYGSWDPPGARLLDAVAVTDRLQSSDPWRREQTHRTLAKYLLEEAYEAYDAIVAGDHAAMRDEMGDVLLQVLFHAQLAQELPEDERWNVDDVAGDFVAKMIRRNPHVFADTPAEDIDEIIATWERVKAEEKGAARSPLDGVTWSLPSLTLAAKLLARARRHGLPEPEPADTLGGRLLTLVAQAGEDADAEAALREELRRYAEAVADQA
ncbi:nucleoside triphosphate pyrophosphohydrolase [Catellatospora methionotrophica]|uniref:Nucleoside triphosphate pyrophosphohydrolase n=1 Tax=Catellatospora methionotrophica TaxID=121620 RepID=A0A8J3PFM6_9ACTN|nr:MazG family protein [Catellatospora methionotrophica]GIG13391.1 nucleoside triphosphate pyrophosphohydrolase [Catellatospora methionotrophica]